MFNLTFSIYLFTFHCRAVKLSLRLCRISNNATPIKAKKTVCLKRLKSDRATEERGNEWERLE